jgi:hypothetical protein
LADTYVVVYSVKQTLKITTSYCHLDMTTWIFTDYFKGTLNDLEPGAWG